LIAIKYYISVVIRDMILDVVPFLDGWKDNSARNRLWGTLLGKIIERYKRKGYD